MIKIYDGRNEFYQWDLDRKLIVDDTTVTELHFCNKTSDCSLVVEVRDGVADVPNILLQTDWTINVYAYCGDCYTKEYAAFKVNRRSKPDDYVYTETEVKAYETLEKRLDELEKNLDENIGNVVVDYLEEHPVSIDLTNYYTKTEIDNKGYITEHQSLEGYATEQYVDDAISNIDIPEVDFTGYATEEYVTNAITTALGVIENGTY